MMPRCARVRRARAAAAAALLVITAAVVAASACGSGGLFGKRYEYEEDVTLGLDGSATLVINASIPALVALRGLDLDPKAARVDRNHIRALYESPVTEVRRVSRPWRRNGRSFVQVRVVARDIRQLSQAAPFNWSRYELTAGGGEHTFRQSVGPSALKPGTLTNVGWDGSEVVAFRLHLPSRIIEHNSRNLETEETESVARGNILAWEQRLADRLEGRPVEITVRMSSESILYRTLWLFAAAFGAAVLLLGTLIWWTVRKGTRHAAQSVQAR